MTAANERADREEPKEKAYVAVIAYIKQLVQDGQLSFGGKLPSERDMMATLSLGRNSIREALQDLEQQNFGAAKKTLTQAREVTEKMRRVIVGKNDVYECFRNPYDFIER